jgi:hypothetical protein
MGSVTLSEKQPFGCDKALDAHRSTSVNAASAYANLSSQAKSVAVGHAGARIVKHTGAVDVFQKLCSGFIFN